MKKNISVVGCGYWGKNLIRNFYELGVLESISELNKELAQNFEEKYMIKNRDFDDILSDKSIEGIVISVPAKLHYEIAIKSIKAKKNVYVEKPLALESDQALEMIDLAKKNNVKAYGWSPSSIPSCIYKVKRAMY